jgi:hypothetical protein
MVDTSQEIDTQPGLKRSTVELIRELKRTGQPIVLMISGKAELLVEDATSVLKLLDLVDRLETIEAIREGMRQIEEGQGVSLEEFKNAVHMKHGIPL